mgnify:CR=1 FL=1
MWLWKTSESYLHLLIYYFIDIVDVWKILKFTDLSKQIGLCPGWVGILPYIWSSLLPHLSFLFISQALRHSLVVNISILCANPFQLLRKFFLTPDVNECKDRSHRCDKNANCTNTDGSYTCMCRSGYSGDGYNCSGKCFHCYDWQ